MRWFKPTLTADEKFNYMMVSILPVGANSAYTTANIELAVIKNAFELGTDWSLEAAVDPTSTVAESAQLGAASLIATASAFAAVYMTL